MPNPALVVLGACLVLGTMALHTGAIYFGGGTAAIRRQSPKLVALTIALFAIVFIRPAVMDVVGGSTWTILLVGLSAALVLFWLVQRQRGDGPLVVERQRAAFRIRGFRILTLLWVSAIVVGTILVVMVAKASS